MATLAEAVVWPGVVALAPSDAVMLRVVPDPTKVEEQLYCEPLRGHAHVPGALTIVAFAAYVPRPPEIVNTAGTQLPPEQPGPVPNARPLTAGSTLAGGVSVRAPFTVSVFETGELVAEGVEAFATSDVETPKVDVAAVVLAVPLQTTAVFPPFAAQVIPAGAEPVTLKV
jgi:hypothetical protein